MLDFAANHSQHPVLNLHLSFHQHARCIHQVQASCVSKQLCPSMRHHHDADQTSPQALFIMIALTDESVLIMLNAAQQPRGYGGYHGTDGGQENDGGAEGEGGPGEASPQHVKESHIPRELRRLHEHSVSLSDSDAKSNHPGLPRRTRASSVPDPTSTSAPARQQLASQSADQGVNKRYRWPACSTLLELQHQCTNSAWP